MAVIKEETTREKWIDEKVYKAVLVIMLMIASGLWIRMSGLIGTSDLYKPIFQMANILRCEITESTKKSDVGDFLVLTDMFTNTPSVNFPLGGTQVWDKLLEDENVVTIEVVTSSGGTDNITINKNDGTFSRSSTSVWAGSQSFSGFCVQ
jgi:hypothetical protein